MDPNLLFGGGVTLITLLTIVGSCVFSVVIFAVVGFIIWRVMKGMGPNRELLKTGIPAKATIRQVWQTGTYLNNNPQVGLQLEVQPPNGPAYMAQTTIVVPIINIPQFQPGVVMPVKISPTDPSQVALDVYGPQG